MAQNFQHVNAPSVSSCVPLWWEEGSMHQAPLGVELQGHELRVREMEAVQYEYLFKTKICWTRTPEMTSGLSSLTQLTRGRAKAGSQCSWVLIPTQIECTPFKEGSRHILCRMYVGDKQRWLYPVSKCDRASAVVCFTLCTPSCERPPPDLARAPGILANMTR